jgi:hypothetical protein
MNIIKTRLGRSAVITVASLAMLGATTQAASAATTSPGTRITVTATQQTLADRILALKTGESLTIPASDGTPAFTVTRTATGLSVNVASSTDTVTANGVCTYAVAAGVWALGAAVIGAVAAAGGTLVVAGVVLSPGVLGMLAGAMGSYSAVEAIIAAYVC